MDKLIIGNIISFCSSTSAMIGCCSKSKKTMFLLQFLECTLLAVASVFFESYAAITTLLLCAVRNLLVAYGKFSKPLLIAFLILVPLLGIITNNRGFIGLLPVIATIQYTLCCYIIKNANGMRFAILANLACWITYSFLICDFSTGIIDSITASVDIFAIIRDSIKKKKAGH